MNLTFEQIKTIDTESVYFQFDDNDIERANSNHEKYSNNWARNNAIVNHICYEKILPWIQENLEPEESAKPFPNEQEYSQLWEYMNGSAVDIDKVRLVIIPDENYDTEEFCVSQEWIDIPKLAGDYYLAVQVDLEEKWLRIWGFSTHKTIKQQAYYDSLYRNYSLDRDQIIDDLEVIWLAKEMNAEDKLTVADLPVMITSKSDKLLDKLSQVSPFSPRLDVPFEQWATILNEDSLRSKLYQNRIGISVTDTVSQSISQKVQDNVVDLSQWLKNNFAEAIKAGWKPINELITPNSLQLSYRSLKSIQSRGESIGRGRKIDLQTSIGDTSIVMNVLLTPESSGKMGCLVQIHPSKPDKYLVPNLSLSIICNSKQLFKPVVSRTVPLDRYIQSKYVVFTLNTSFEVCINYDDLCIKQIFVC